MIKAKCIGKYRDNNNIITGYDLIDEQSKVRQFEPKELKELILNRTIDVINLKLTSDGKLIDRTAKEYYTKVVEDIQPKPDVMNNILFKRYNQCFKDVGIDLVGAFYVMIDKYDCTKANILRHNDVQMDSQLECTLDSVLNNPEQFIGYFNTLTDYHNYDNINSRGTSKKSAVRLPILILHRNAEFKAVMFYEIEYDDVRFIFGDELDFSSIEQIISRQQLKNTSKKSNYPIRLQCDDESTLYQKGYKIITMTENGKLKSINLQSYLSENESRKLYKNLIESDIRNWVNKENYEHTLSILSAEAEKYAKSEADADKLRFKINSVATYGVAVPLLFLMSPILLAGNLVKEVTDCVKEIRNQGKED